MNLKGRSFLTLKDYSPAEIQYLLDLAASFKERKKKGIPALRLGKRKVLLTQPESLAGCMRALNIGDLDRKS